MKAGVTLAMKKAIIILLAFSCVLGITACGKSENDSLKINGNPEKIIVITDDEGYQKEICFTSKEEISDFMELYNKVEVGEMNDIMTTDSYNSISFFYADGSSTTLSINGSSLEKEVDGQLHYFELINLKPLWSYIDHADTVPEDGE